jgi:hypothetical protein
MKLPDWPAIAEGIRIGAPIPLTLFAAAIVVIFWLGGWPIETAELRVRFLGIGLLVLLLLLGLALFLGKDGIKSVNLELGAAKLNMTSEDKDEQS